MGFWDSLANGLNSIVQAATNDLNGGMNGGTNGGVSFSDLAQRQQYANFLTREDYSMVGASREAYFKRLADEAIRVGADKTPNTLVGGIYTTCVNLLRNNGKPRLHQCCMSFCICNESECEECLERRLKAANAILMINNQEEYYNQFVVGNGGGTEPIRCTLCGAPVPVGQSECEYCGSLVSFEGEKIHVGSKADIPDPVMAAYNLVQEVIDKYTETPLYLANANMVVDIYACSQTGVYNFADIINANRQSVIDSFMLKKSRMTYSQISHMANVYGLDIPTYLYGYLTQEGDIGNYAEYSYNEQSKQNLDQKMAENAAAIDRLEKFKQQSIQKSKEINQIIADSRNRSASKGTGYQGGGGGGTDHCCGTCANYITSMNKCSYETDLSYTRNANDHCGRYTSR